MEYVVILRVTTNLIAVYIIPDYFFLPHTRIFSPSDQDLKVDLLSLFIFFFLNLLPCSSRATAPTVIPPPPATCVGGSRHQRKAPARPSNAYSSSAYPFRPCRPRHALTLPHPRAPQPAPLPYGHHRPSPTNLLHHPAGSATAASLTAPTPATTAGLACHPPPSF